MVKQASKHCAQTNANDLRSCSVTEIDRGFRADLPIVAKLVFRHGPKWTNLLFARARGVK